jgi:hypothetical protein
MPQEKVTYQLAVRTTISIFAVTSTLMGIDMTVSGPARFTAPALATARTVPGGVWTWGAIIAAGGALTLTGSIGWHRRVVMAGLTWMGLVFGFFDIALWTSRFADPRAAVTGCWTYLMVAAACGVLIVSGHRLRPREEPSP